MQGEDLRPLEPVPPDRRRQRDSGREHGPVLRYPLACRGEQGPAAGERQQPRLPPALPESQVQSGGAAEQAVEQESPGTGVLGRAHRARAEIAGGDDQGGDAPPAPRGHHAEPRRHAEEVQQQEIGIGAVLAQQNRGEEGAERGREAERLDIDGVGDHGERDRNQGEPHDARGRREHAIQLRGRPDTEIDDTGPASDQRRAVGPVPGLEPPTQRADPRPGDHTADAAHHRRNPPSLEAQLEQVASRQKQRDDTDAEKDALADPPLRIEPRRRRGPDRAGARGWTRSGRRRNGWPRGERLRGSPGRRRIHGRGGGGGACRRDRRRRNRARSGRTRHGARGGELPNQRLEHSHTLLQAVEAVVGAQQGLVMSILPPGT
jgi:hypothetical protein